MAVNVQQSIYTELANFLVTQPTLEELAAYKVSPGIQQYIDDRLERNREEGLSAQEPLGLDFPESVEVFLLVYSTSEETATAEFQDLMVTGR